MAKPCKVTLSIATAVYASLRPINTIAARPKKSVATMCVSTNRPVTTVLVAGAAHPLLATTRGGLDQSTTTGKQHQTSYFGDGRLIGGRDVIFAGGHRKLLSPLQSKS